jgi:hypothetical protein
VLAGLLSEGLSTHRNFRWSSPEKGENFTNSASSTPEFMFEFTDLLQINTVEFTTSR